jgi:transposase-like protein
LAGWSVMSVNEGPHEARWSALPERVEVRVRSGHRRTWSDQDKLAIVRETPAPGAVTQVVADRHGAALHLRSMQHGHPRQNSPPTHNPVLCR